MSNYTKGRVYEYKAKKQLEAEGYTVIRAAGSHGPWDLIAMRGEEPVRCIQIKRTKAINGHKTILNQFKRNQRGKLGFTTYREEMWVWYGGSWFYSFEAPQDTKYPRTAQMLDVAQPDDQC